jgi:hypothetical protein
MEDSRETLDSKPSHYHNAPCDVLELQGYVMHNFWHYIVDNDKIGQNKEWVQRLWCIGSMMKHVMRLGLKDDVDIELKKIENYAHRARTGSWMDE